MITLALARTLRDSGVRWTPAAGDRFIVDNERMTSDVFVLSDMTVEVHELPTGRILGFNGTTEWALDSVEEHEALWLPREGQLRELLGGTFQALARAGDEWTVTITVSEHVVVASHADVEQAYGLALLALITGELLADLPDAPPASLLEKAPIGD